MRPINVGFLANTDKAFTFVSSAEKAVRYFEEQAAIGAIRFYLSDERGDYRRRVWDSGESSE